MKRFLKKANRGLILGGVLLLGLTLMILIRNAQFNREIPQIGETAESFVKEFLELNLSPEGLAVGENPTPAQLEAKKQALIGLGETYWYDEAISGKEDSLLPFAKITEGLEEYWSRDRDFILTEIDFSISSYDIEVFQNGPDYAKVSIYTDTVSATVQAYEESGFALYLGSNTHYDTHIAIIPDDKTEIETDPSLSPEEPTDPTLKTYDCIYYVNATLELKRVNGEWRVVDFNGHIHSAQVNEKTAEGGNDNA